MTYYNENDPKAAAWLRELIKADLIAPGGVDERSIEDVTVGDLRGFTQHHFFAGIGGWSYALRLAGWPDDRPVWTGSCPCQPFSAAGKRKGTADERHLWPSWHWLIKEYRPEHVFGEQVASKDGIIWLDLVSTDLEGEGYTFWPVVFPACGVGAPHKRERIWFVANSKASRRSSRRASQESTWSIRFDRPCAISGVGDTSGERAGRHTGTVFKAQRETFVRSIGNSALASGSIGKLEHSNLPGDHERSSSGKQPVRDVDHKTLGVGHPESDGRLERGTESNWGSAEWCRCTDGKYRAIEPGVQPLAHGIPHRMGRLRGYGNAIVPQAAAQIISAYMEIAL